MQLAKTSAIPFLVVVILSFLLVAAVRQTGLLPEGTVSTITTGILAGEVPPGAVYVLTYRDFAVRHYHYGRRPPKISRDGYVTIWNKNHTRYRVRAPGNCASRIDLIAAITE